MASTLLMCFSNIANINIWGKEFSVEVATLFFCLNGYINFLPLGRFGKCEDRRYR
jgi:hypothetical protein